MTIDRENTIKALLDEGLITEAVYDSKQPPAHSEPLTYDEQIMFLLAMDREEKICKELKYGYLIGLCRNIKRKVKKALWLNY